MKKYDKQSGKIITVDDVRLCKWLTCYDNLVKLGFTDDEIDNAINNANFDIDLLTETQGLVNITWLNGVYDILKSNYVFNEKVYTTKDDVQCEGYKQCRGFAVRKPSHYQGLKHGEIIFNLLCNKYDWFNTFMMDKLYKEAIVEIDSCNKIDIDKLSEEQKKLTINELIELSKAELIIKQKSSWTLYEMRNLDYDMYLTTEFGSLYVPIIAILNNDFKIIKNRMITYSKSYYNPGTLAGFALNHRNRTEEQYLIDRQKDYETMIKPLKSKEAKRLKLLLKPKTK